MENQLYISAFCKIKNNAISVNENVVFQEDSVDFAEFSKKAYKSLEESYSKFFKMDNLCKLSYLSTEFLAKSFGKFNENTAIVLSNNASSLDTDRKHQKSISDKENYFPSPAVFVYTLPNIAIGEISIKHQLKSENAFFVSEKYNPKLLFEYATILIANNKTNSVLCGWVNFDQNEYESLLFLISKEKSDLKFNTENINII